MPLHPFKATQIIGHDLGFLEGLIETSLTNKWQYVNTSC